MISVVVSSYNEGDKLDSCLSSVYHWADEIIVINMESKDNTSEIARKYLARVINYHFIDYIEPVREFAVSHAKNKWVLVLDPDETVTSKLKDELSEIIKEDKIDVVNIPRLNFIFSQKIKHTNFWPDRQIRFFRKDKVRFSTMIHSYPQPLGKLVNLPAKEELAIQHHSYKNPTEYLSRIERYSSIEARNRLEHGQRFSVLNLLYEPLYDFARRYIRHLGILDGWNGLLLSCLQAYYYVLVEIKLFKGR